MANMLRLTKKPPYTAVFRDGQKVGSKVLVLADGFPMSRANVENDNAYFFCRSCNVKATVKISTNMVTRVKGEHDHDNDLCKDFAKKFEKEAIRRR